MQDFLQKSANHIAKELGWLHSGFYSSEDFLNFVQSKLNPEFVQLETAQLENIQKRDVRKSNENPSIGMILCPSADQVVVEYAMSRSMSPTLIAEYKKKLIPQETVQKLLGEYCASFEMGAKQREKVSTKRKNKWICSH